MTSIATGNRRLLKLAAFLRNLPRNRFDYTQFVGDDWEGAPDLSCGTTACAMGWATTMPEFRRLGLRLAAGGYPHIQGRGSGIAAAETLFALGFGDAMYLFVPGLGEHPATPKQVAAKIERFVRGRQ